MIQKVLLLAIISEFLPRNFPNKLTFSQSIFYLDLEIFFKMFSEGFFSKPRSSNIFLKWAAKIYGPGWGLENGALWFVLRKWLPLEERDVWCPKFPIGAPWTQWLFKKFCHDVHWSDGKIGVAARTDSAQAVTAKLWEHVWAIVVMIDVQKGCETPPLTKYEMWPFDWLSPKPTDSVWMESTKAASFPLSLPMSGSKTVVICPGSSPVSLPTTNLRFVRVCTVLLAKAWFWAPRENPTKWRLVSASPASINLM